MATVPFDAESQIHSDTSTAAVSLNNKLGEKVNIPTEKISNERERNDLDWDGPDDPSNPRNWTFGKKSFNTALPAIYTFLITLTTSSYVPSLPLLMTRFNVSQEVSLLGLSLYTFGLCTGPLISAPLSELFGRRPVYWTTLLLLLAFQAGAGGAQNIETLLICRALAGIGGSGAVAIGAGTIAELWDLARDGGPAALLFTLGPFVGSSIGYLTGAYIVAEYDYNWRWSMWVILIVGAPIAIASIFMSETSKKSILLVRQKSRGGALPPPPTNSIMHEVGLAIYRPAHMMCTEPLVSYLSIYTGFTFAMLFSFFGSYSYVFQSVYHFTAKETGLAFLGILPGYLLGVITFGIFDKTLYAKARKAANGNAAPEHRLYAAMLGSLLMPVGLFWFAWGASDKTHWIVPILAGVPFGWSMIAIFLSSTTYLIDVYQAATGASALAANGILRYTLGAVFPLFTIQIYEGLGIHWAGSLFAFVSLLLIPIPWLFFKYGKQLRARSGYDTVTF